MDQQDIPGISPNGQVAGIDPLSQPPAHMRLLARGEARIHEGDSGDTSSCKPKANDALRPSQTRLYRRTGHECARRLRNRLRYIHTWVFERNSRIPIMQIAPLSDQSLGQSVSISTWRLIATRISLRRVGEHPPPPSLFLRLRSDEREASGLFDRRWHSG